MSSCISSFTKLPVVSTSVDNHINHINQSSDNHN
jgi:hypothetical protein